MIDFLCIYINLLITSHAILLFHDRHRADYDPLGNWLRKWWFDYVEDFLCRHVLPILWYFAVLGLLLCRGLLLIGSSHCLAPHG